MSPADPTAEQFRVLHLVHAPMYAGRKESSFWLVEAVSVLGNTTEPHPGTAHTFYQGNLSG